MHGDLQWNRVSNLEPAAPKAETLPLGHRGLQVEDESKCGHQKTNKNIIGRKGRGGGYWVAKVEEEGKKFIVTQKFREE
ncbi:hypothetical protein AVEN_273158-1 [Araneus ventricosus]|uniref:Uncharacterized protein n=1 Tax=Araneus ventricosus TaxID=182803 RepID=A0A4Y2K5T9_ARAVE|nr:hypothetical protein AVEN_273158-1 [Araneus ventricosus]